MLILVVTIGFFLWLMAGYPLVLLLLARLKKPAHAALTPFAEETLPSLSILVPVYNARGQILRKLKELRAVTYPAHKLEIIFIDGNSLDGTAELLEVNLVQGERLIRETQRLGKVCSVDRGIREAAGEIVLITDADSSFLPDLPARMVDVFADPQVGGVSASRRPAGRDRFSGGFNYWSFDSSIKKLESAVSSAVGLIGEAMAVRRSAFNGIAPMSWAAPAGADDTALTYFLIKNGYRVQICPGAAVTEDEPENWREFCGQRRRVICHNIHNLLHEPSMLGLRFGLFSALLIPTRRVMPLFMPLFLVLLCLSIVRFGVCSNLEAAAKFCLVPALLVAATLSTRRLPGRAGALSGLIRYFLLLNLSIVLGVFDALRGKTYVTWPRYHEEVPAKGAEV